MNETRGPVHVIGIDVGGTKTAAGIATLPGGQMFSRRTIPTDPQRGGRAVLDDVCKLAVELREEASVRGQRIALLGLGICELVNREGQVASANCIQWLNEPVCEELNAIAPAFLEADVRAAALAESVLGAGRNLGSFLYITIGTGISCCLMQQGEPFLGAHGATGTMASSPLSNECPQCHHRHERTLEEIASGPALVAGFKTRGGKAVRGHDVLAAAMAGDGAALEVIRAASEALGGQVGLLVNTLDPEAVIVGGGLGLSEGPYWDSFIGSTRRHIWSAGLRELPIVRAATGADAGWLGAAVAAWRRGERAGSDVATGCDVWD